MDVIIIIKNGVPEIPILVKNPITAEAEYNRIAEKLCGDDWISFKNIIDYGFKMDSINKYLKSFGVEIHWFTELKVNKYKNK
jgi:hypothetical protein